MVTRRTLTVPKSIDATGKRDVTEELNDWLHAARNGVRVKFQPKGTYLCEGSVTVDEKTNVIVEGNGAQILSKTDGTGAIPNDDVWYNGRNWPLNRSHLIVYRCTDTVVQNFRIKGANPGGPNTYWPRVEAQSGIDIANSTRCRALNNRITNNYGDGVQVWNDCHDIRVAKNSIHHNGRQGITVVDTVGAVLKDNCLHDIARSVIDLEPGPGGWDDKIEIVGNYIVGPTGGVFLGMTGKGSTDNVYVHDNHLLIPLIIKDENSDNKSRRGPIRVESNVTEWGYDNYPIGMMIFALVDGVTIKWNKAVAKVEEAVRLYDCTGVTISGNSWQR